MGHATDEYEDMVREEARRQALQDEIDRLRPDAERYRWLRREHASDGPSYHVRRMNNDPAPKDLDSDIDAAMREQGANTRVNTRRPRATTNSEMVTGRRRC